MSWSACSRSAGSPPIWARSDTRRPPPRTARLSAPPCTGLPAARYRWPDGVEQEASVAVRVRSARVPLRLLRLEQDRPGVRHGAHVRGSGDVGRGLRHASTTRRHGRRPVSRQPRMPGLPCFGGAAKGPRRPCPGTRPRPHVPRRPVQDAGDHLTSLVDVTESEVRSAAVDHSCFTGLRSPGPADALVRNHLVHRDPLRPRRPPRALHHRPDPGVSPTGVAGRGHRTRCLRGPPVRPTTDRPGRCRRAGRHEPPDEPPRRPGRPA